MEQIVDWIFTHRDTISTALAALYALAAAVVAMTPSGPRRRTLRRILERLSFLAPRNARGKLSLPGRDPWVEDERRRELDGFPLWAVAMVTAAALTGQACGGSAIQGVRTGAAGLAVGVTIADPIIASRARDARDAHEAGEISDDELEERVVRLERTNRALGSLSRALQALDLALSAVEEGRACGTWRAAVDSVVAAAHEVVAALEAAEIDVPELVTPAVAIAGMLVEAEDCDVEAGHAALELGGAYL